MIMEADNTQQQQLVSWRSRKTGGIIPVPIPADLSLGRANASAGDQGQKKNNDPDQGSQAGAPSCSEEGRPF